MDTRTIAAAAYAALLAVVCCTPFASAPADAGAASDAGADGAAAPDGRAADDAGLRPDGSCGSVPLFFEDFASAAVEARWDVILADGGISANGQLVSRIRGGDQRAQLVKKLRPCGRSVTVRLKAKGTILAGEFGPDTRNDYCELVAFHLGDHQAAILYEEKNLVAGWVWNEDETVGILLDPLPARLRVLTPLTLRFSWDDTEARLLVSAPDASDSKSHPLRRAQAESPLEVRVGASCFGRAPDYEVTVDDVTIVE